MGRNKLHKHQNRRTAASPTRSPKSQKVLQVSHPGFANFNFSVALYLLSANQENSDSSDLPSSGESLVTVSAAAVVPAPAPPPAKKFFKKSRIVEEDLKEDVVEGDGEDAPPSSRQRPRRPAQRTERMSPRPPVPRSPLQARSPLQVLFHSSDDFKYLKLMSQVKSPQQEMSSPRQSPRSPQPLSRVARDPPSRVARKPPAPNSQSPPSQPISLPSSEPSSDPFDVMRTMKRGKRKLDEDKEEALVPSQPPLKLKLSLTKSPVKGNVEFSVVGTKEGKRRGRPVEGASSSPEPGERLPSPPPKPQSPKPVAKRKVKRPAVIEDDPGPQRSPSPRSPSLVPTVKRKAKAKVEEEPPPSPPAPPITKPLPTVKRKVKKVVEEVSQAPRSSSPPPSDITKRKTRQDEGRSEALLLKSKIEDPLPVSQRRRASPPPRKPLSPVQRPGSPDPVVSSESPSPDDTELHFPARIQARDLTAPKPQVSTKKSIFKSRSKPDPAPTVKEASPLQSEKPAPAPFLEEPRVPLISSSHDLFKAWDKEIPSCASPASSSGDHDNDAPVTSPLRKEDRIDPPSKPPVKTFSRKPVKIEEKLPPLKAFSNDDDAGVESLNTSRIPSAGSEDAKPLKTFSRLKREDTKEGPPIDAPPQVKNAAPPKLAKPVVRGAPSLPARGDQSPEFKINFPTRIAQPQPPSLPSGRVVGQKRSIFKSKSKENTAPPKKALSLYKHKMGWGGEDRERKSRDEESSSQPSSTAELLSSYDDSEFDDEPSQESDLSFAPGRLQRVATYPASNTGIDEDGDMVTQVKCPKSYKEYYTVIKKVKKAHEMNDMGEYQEFADDVEYIADGLKVRNSTAARCLAAVSLAQKCMKPSFR